MENVIQSFWFGKTISTLERLSITSFLKNGHDVHIYAYDEINNLPPGVTQLDANIILHRDKLFYDNSGGIASFSDWFRYKMLYEKGGWWVDLDIVCLKPFQFDDDYCFATENFSANFETGVTNCVIKSPAKAEFLEMILEKIESFENYIQIEWGEFGPALINKILKSFESSKYVQPASAFCPVDWPDVGKIVMDEELILSSSAFAVHMWNNLWRINNINKELSYDPKSLYEILKLKYL